jgi:transcriptional regulator with XRE-family HTH domain
MTLLYQQIADKARIFFLEVTGETLYYKRRTKMQREAFNMQAVETETKSHYSNGFKKNIQRSKHNLPLNERLKSARNRKGLSSAGVVRALKKKGVSIGHSTLQGYEADENSLNHRYPSLMVLIELATFYEVSFDYLFGISDKFTPQHLSVSHNTDVKDILESRTSIMYNGVKLNKQQRESMVKHLDKLLAL